VDELLRLYVPFLNFLIPFSPFSSPVLGYSVTLLIVVVLHAPLVPGVWHSNVSEIPWFAFPASSASRITHDPLPSDKADLEGRTVYGDAFHSSPEIKRSRDDQYPTLKAPPRPPWLNIPRGSLTVSVASFTPAWAKQYNVGLTRGLHNPFNTSTDEGSTDNQTLSDPVQRPARALTKPTHEDRLHERDDDPFAAPGKHDSVVTNVSDDYDDTKQPLRPLTGFSNLPRWFSATTSGGINGQDQDTEKRGIGMLMLRNPSDRSSNTTVTTTTAVLSPLGRKSVSSLFPHDVRDEDWNLPLTKPPFRNGQGEGWTTADATQEAVPAGKGRGRR
jgi:hypothetical protein